MICQRCGKEIQPGSAFCENCGNPTQSNAVNTYNSGVQQMPVQQPKKKSKTWLFVLLGLLGVAIIGVILVVVVVAIIIFASNSSSVSFERDGVGVVEMQEEDESASVYEEREESNSYEEYGTGSNQYFFPSDKKQITFSILDEYSQDEIAIIRNEIYARHGYVFQLEQYARYFESKEWYSPNPYFDESVFSELEKDNIDTIIEYETGKGWR